MISPGVTVGPHSRDVVNNFTTGTQYHDLAESLRVSWDMGGPTLMSITSHDKFLMHDQLDQDETAQPSIDNRQFGNFSSSQWTQELRLASSDAGAAFKWQFGGFYFDQRDTTDFYQRRFFLSAPFVAANGNTNNPGNWVRLHDANTSWAVFGQASYTIDRLTLTAGGRYTEDNKRTILVKPATTGATVNFPATAPRNRIGSRSRASSWQPSAPIRRARARRVRFRPWSMNSAR